MSITIPKDYTRFLYWVKERTEKFWRAEEDASSDFVCEDWIRGASWIGMSDVEIETIEHKYGIKFTEYHKEFLRILHTTDKKRVVDGLDANGNSVSKEVSLFHNWITDEDEILQKMQAPFEFWLKNVLNGTFWLKSWGNRPDNSGERQKIYEDWYQEASKLIPIHSNKFVISEPLETDNAVLSIVGGGAVVFGRNMRHYLLHELSAELDLLKLVYDEEDEGWFEENSEELEAIMVEEFELLKTTEIPYWKEALCTGGFQDCLNQL